MVFSAKNFIAGMLSFYVALRTGLENPAWSAVTTYIMAQPHAGASLSNASYRPIGTLVGACAAIFMAPPLVEAPALLSLTLAAWLVRVFVSLADRTPRDYRKLQRMPSLSSRHADGCRMLFYDRRAQRFVPADMAFNSIGAISPPLNAAV
jgi:uncharacterized membrane protein YccC